MSLVSYKKYRNSLLGNNAFVKCTSCKRFMLLKKYEKHAEFCSRINVSTTCVWCDARYGWKRGSKMQNGAHIIRCFQSREKFSVMIRDARRYMVGPINATNRRSLMAIQPAAAAAADDDDDPPRQILPAPKVEDRVEIFGPTSICKAVYAPVKVEEQDSLPPLVIDEIPRENVSPPPPPHHHPAIDEVLSENVPFPALEITVTSENVSSPAPPVSEIAPPSETVPFPALEITVTSENVSSPPPASEITPPSETVPSTASDITLPSENVFPSPASELSIPSETVPSAASGLSTPSENVTLSATSGLSTPSQTVTPSTASGLVTPNENVPSTACGHSISNETGYLPPSERVSYVSIGPNKVWTEKTMFVSKVDYRTMYKSLVCSVINDKKKLASSYRESANAAKKRFTSSYKKSINAALEAERHVNLFSKMYDTL